MYMQGCLHYKTIFLGQTRKARRFQKVTFKFPSPPYSWSLGGKQEEKVEDKNEGKMRWQSGSRVERTVERRTRKTSWNNRDLSSFCMWNKSEHTPPYKELKWKGRLVDGVLFLWLRDLLLFD
jgi:hypothetical protein